MKLHSRILIVVLVITIGVVAFSFHTPRAKATDLFYFIWQWIIQPLVRALAVILENQLLNKMNSLTRGISSGSPNFITNWRNNVLSAQGRGNDIFRSVLAGSNVCPYFKNKLLAAFGAQQYLGSLQKSKVGQYAIDTFVPGLPSFQQTANCSFNATADPKLNIANFKANFSNGGWSAWNQLIKPQNNFFGAYNLALGEQQKQISTESGANQQQNIANQGFLANKLGTIPDALGKILPFANGCILKVPGTNRCIYEGKTVTPGNVLQQETGHTIQQQIQMLTNVQSPTDIVQFLTNLVVVRLSNQITNLLGLELNGNPVDSASSGSLPTPAPGQIDSLQSQLNSNFNNSITQGNIQICLSNCDSQLQACLGAATGDPTQQTVCNSQDVSCRDTCRGR